jgi:hypothetical protein
MELARKTLEPALLLRGPVPSGGAGRGVARKRVTSPYFRRGYKHLDRPETVRGRTHNRSSSLVVVAKTDGPHLGSRMRFAPLFGLREKGRAYCDEQLCGNHISERP